MKRTALLLTLLTLAAAASATDVGQHPAVFAPRSLPGIDASTFIVGHPAGGAPGQVMLTPQAAPAVQRVDTAMPLPASAAPRREASLRTATVR